MKHLQFVLVLAIAVNVWECGDAKFGERGEISPRRRRCYDGSSPKRLKKRERKVLLDGSGSGGGGGSGEVCHRLYPRVSCCPTRRAAYQILHRRDARVGPRPPRGIIPPEWKLLGGLLLLLPPQTPHVVRLQPLVYCHAASW